MAESNANLNETIQQVMDILIRHRWPALLTTVGLALATVGVVLLLPNHYTSSASLVVVQQQVPQRYVDPATNATPTDTIQAIKREVLSPVQLTAIINELDLYSDQRQRLSPYELVEKMRNDIAIDPLDQIAGRSDFSAITVAFTADTPIMAQSVTKRLTSLFIAENSKTRGDQAVNTSNFLADQLDLAKKKFADQEQRVQDYKARNLGDLPNQQQAALGSLTDLRIQLQNIAANIIRAQQQRGLLETQVRSRLATLQSDRTALLTKFTPRHLEVIKKEQEIARTEALLGHVLGGTGSVGSTEALTSDDPTIIQLKNQADTATSDIETATRDEQRVRAEIANLQGRLSLAPLKEQELAAMMSDLDLYKREYAELVSKQQQSQLTVNLEESQGGQQFRVLDPPNLPRTPSSPKRVKISLGGLAAGLALGLALAFVRDMKNPTFHREKEFSRNFHLPLVLGVPLLLTPAEQRAGSWNRALEWVAACVLTVALTATEFYIYRRG